VVMAWFCLPISAQSWFG